MSTEITAIPKIRQVYYDTYANLPVTGVAVGDLGYATDTATLYRWNGTAWQAITPGQVANTGTYTGDSTVSRAIPHGLGRLPKLVIIIRSDCATMAYIIYGTAYVNYETGATRDSNNTGTPTVTNFYVGHAASYANSMNLNTFGYIWIAL